MVCPDGRAAVQAGWGTGLFLAVAGLGVGGVGGVVVVGAELDGTLEVEGGGELVGALGMGAEHEVAPAVWQGGWPVLPVVGVAVYPEVFVPPPVGERQQVLGLLAAAGVWVPHAA